MPGSANESVVLPSGRGLVADVAETQTAVCVEDVTSDARFDANVDYLSSADGRELVARNVLCVPLMQGTGTQAVGVLQVFNTQASTFSEMDKMLIKMLADQAAVSIRNSMMYQEMSVAQHHTRDFTKLALELSAATKKDVSFLVRKLLEGGKHMLRAEKMFLYILDGDNDKVMIRFDQAGQCKVWSSDVDD